MTGGGQYRTSGRLEGRCLCGAVTIRVDGGYAAAIGACHCSMCQRWTGALYATFDADADAVQVEGAVTRYPSTHFAERAFCGTCGSNLWLRDTNTPDAPYELMPGLFSAAAAFPLISEIYIDRRPAYLPLGGDHRVQTRAEYEAAHNHVEGDAP
jgi:hypothetical protein